MNDPSGFFSLPASQIQAGTLTWVPPQCDQWYADAPQVYDDFFVENVGAAFSTSTWPRATDSP